MIVDGDQIVVVVGNISGRMLSGVDEFLQSLILGVLKTRLNWSSPMPYWALLFFMVSVKGFVVSGPGPRIFNTITASESKDFVGINLSGCLQCNVSPYLHTGIIQTHIRQTSDEGDGDNLEASTNLQARLAPCLKRILICHARLAKSPGKSATGRESSHQ